jgi:hypothetical protein
MIHKDNFQGNIKNHNPVEIDLFAGYSDYFNQSPLDTTQKLQSFAKYVRRQDISRFLAKNELYKLQMELPGVIIECGCYTGGGTMTFAQLSAIYEPYNHTRRIIAFDTFDGFPSIAEKDANSQTEYKKGDLFVQKGIENEIETAIKLFDRNRAISHIPKVTLVKGDAMKTIPAYLKQHAHTIVSLMYLDFDIYEPTKVAIETFIDRMPKGSILAFDELNTPSFPGETLALLETLGIKNVQLKKTIFDPYISYVTI